MNEEEEKIKKNIEKAKQWCIKKTGYYNRLWEKLDTFNLKNERIQGLTFVIYVQDGTPPKSYIIVNDHWTCAITHSGKKYTWKN